MFSERSNTFSPSLNFQVFYRIFNKQKLGVFATTFIILLSFLELCSFFYHEIALIDYTDSDLLQLIRTFASYATVLSLIQIDNSVLIGARYVAPFINIAYLLIFLINRLLTSRGTVSNSLDRIFGLYTLYYTRIALIPIFEILFREVSCDSQLFTLINQECLTGVNIFPFVLAILGIVSGLIMTIITLYYSMNGIYDKKNYMSGENRLWDASLAFVHIMTPLIVIVGGNTWTLIMTHIAFHVAFSSFLLWYFMTFYPYNKAFIELVTVIYVTIYWIQSVVSIFGVGIKEVTPDIGLLYGLLIVVSVPGVVFVYKTMKRRLIIKTNVKSSKVLLRQIQAILQLKSSEKLSSEEETYFRGLICRHKISCHNLHCFCKRDELYDPKKDKNFDAEKWPTLKTLVLKYYVRFLFEEAIENGASDSTLLISYAEFLFHKFRNTHLAAFQIHKLLQSNKFLYPNERLIISKLQQRISGYINSRNLEALEKPLEIEHVIFIEEQLEKVLQGMQKIISTSIAFWSYLTNKDIELDKLKNLADEMHKSVEETTKLWGPLKPYLYKQKKIMYYYNWFLKDFLQKKIILSEEEVDDLFENDTASFYSNDFFSTLKDDHVLFQEDSAVVHMSGDNHDLGKILKTNNGALKIFGYNQEELERANVDILMPNIIAHRHQYYLNSFILTGKTEVLYNQRKTFAKDKRGHIMPIWIVVKQLNNLDGHVQYAGLMRPLSQKKDEQNYYILMNNFGEISGVSKNFIEFMNIREDIFQKTEVNIIMLAPKLIKYFFFAKMLYNDNHTMGTMGSGLLHQEGSKTIASFSSTLKSRKFSDFVSVAKRSPLKAFVDLDDLKDEDEVIEKDEEKEERDAKNDAEVNYEKGDYCEVEFTLRIPRKLKSFVKEFNQLKSRHHDLLNNQQLFFEAIQSKNFGKSTAFEDLHHVPSSPESPTRRKKLGHFTNFRHAVDAYIGALKHTADKMVKAGQNNVYRVKGVLVTDYYGPDRDVIKYLKILEIVKKSQKSSNLTDVPLSHKNSEASELTQSTSFHNMQTLRGFRKSVKTSKTEKDDRDDSNEGNLAKMAKEEVIQSEDLKIRLLEGETPKGSQDRVDPGSSTSRAKSVKIPGSMKSLQKSDDLEEKDNASNASSDRQAINNELKNNILTHTASIYQKEDHMMIDKRFRGLRNVKWFIRILFLSLIPLNIITYLVGPWTTFRQLGNSVDDIFSNEDLRRNYIRCHNAIITLILSNNGAFDSLRITDSDAIDRLVQYELDIIDSAYQHIYDGSSKDEWTTIVYNYAPKSAKDVQLNYEGSFSGSVTTIQNAIQQLMNSLFTIKFYEQTDFTLEDSELIFYRINSFEKFNKILGDVTNEIFVILGNNFDNSENLAIIILILEGLLFFLSFFVIMRLILVVIWSLREVLVIFTVIDNQQVLETVKHYSRLLEFLEASNACYMTVMHEGHGNLTRKELHKIRSLKYMDDQKQRLQKKVKKINNANFMRGDSIKILSYYALSILLCFSLSLLFHFQAKVTIDFIQNCLADGLRFIQLSPTYITSLIAFKELYFNRTDYQKYNLPFMQDIITQLETTLSRTGYNSDLGFVRSFREILDGEPCETFIGLMPDVEDQRACNSAGTGDLIKGLSLSTGLISFHNGYSNAIFDILTLDNAENYGSTSPKDIYELGQFIKIIDDVFMEDTLIRWRNNMKDYLASKEQFLAILIVFVSILNVGVYFVAKRVVVGVLKERFYFYRKIYNEYMLGEAPVKEKRIKAILVKYKLLHK